MKLEKKEIVWMGSYSPEGQEGVLKHLQRAYDYHNCSEEDAIATGFKTQSEPIQNTNKSREALHFTLEIYTTEGREVYRFMTGMLTARARKRKPKRRTHETDDLCTSSVGSSTCAQTTG